MENNKKLNNQDISPYYAIDIKTGKLKFLTICPKLNAKPAEYWLLDQPKRLEKEFGLVGALEFYKYKF